MQEFAPSKHLGKRLQMTMWTKTDDVDGFVAPWMRVDGAGGSGKPLCFDNMCERRVKGTTGWTKHQIVLDVPNDSVNIAFGVILSGKGKVWIDDIAFEEVGANVAATDCPCSRRSRAVPRNLNFEKDQEG